MGDRHVKQWVWFACERNQVLEFAQTIIVEWNPRFTRKMGDAGFNFNAFRARIRLSIPLWSRASAQDQRQTVIHETCHCIVGYKHGKVRRPHGPEWQEAMRNCGVEPIRTHNVDRTGLTRRQRLFVLLDCPNEHQCRMTVRDYNLAQAGCVLECKRCGLVVTQASPMVEDQRSVARTDRTVIAGHEVT